MCLPSDVSCDVSDACDACAESCCDSPRDLVRARTRGHRDDLVGRPTRDLRDDMVCCDSGPGSDACAVSCCDSPRDLVHARTRGHRDDLVCCDGSPRRYEDDWVCCENSPGSPNVSLHCESSFGEHDAEIFEVCCNERNPGSGEESTPEDDATTDEARDALYKLRVIQERVADNCGYTKAGNLKPGSLTAALQGTKDFAKWRALFPRLKQQHKVVKKIMEG